MKINDVYSPTDSNSNVMPNIYLTAIITIMCACDILAFKIITVFGFQIALSGFLFPIAFFLLYVVNESYGYKLTERTILMAVVAQVVFLSLMMIAIRLPSTIAVKSSDLYFQLFHDFWRVFLSGTLGVSLSFLFSSFFNSHLKIWLLGKNKLMRFVISTGTAKAILVIISYPINFYGILSTEQILIICFNTWAFKVLIGSLFAPVHIPVNPPTDSIFIRPPIPLLSTHPFQCYSPVTITHPYF